MSGTIRDGVRLVRRAIFGVGADYSEFERDGTLEFNGAATVWEDANIGGVVLGGPVATHPDEVEILDSTGTATGIYGLGFATGEDASGFIEVPHAAKTGADVTLHLHWTGNDAPTGTDNVRWSVTYFTVGNNTVIPASTTVEVEGAYDTQYERVSVDLATFTANPMDQLGFTIERITAVGDAYAGDAIVLTVGIHYEIDTVGTRQITTK